MFGLTRLSCLPGAFLAGVVGILVDLPTISLIALIKSPFMLFKGWNRLFHDLIGREGPFLETVCVPFAGLAILLWPAAVVGAVLASVISSLFLGGYAAVIAYQVWLFARHFPLLVIKKKKKTFSNHTSKWHHEILLS